MQLIGQPLPRVDAPQKVRGAATYTGEAQISDVLHAVLVGSTIARGRITRLETGAAEAAPGVRLVLTHLNMPTLVPAKDSMDFMALRGEHRLPLQDDIIHHAGQYIALVAAETLEQAAHAATLLQVEYERETPLTSLEDNADKAHLPKDFLGMVEIQYARGDAAAALEAAPIKLQRTWTTPYEHHTPMEPNASLAWWEGPERLVIHDATQAMMGSRRILADIFGLAAENVHVVCPFVGGAFGNKGFVWPNTILAAAAARVAGRPVKLVLSRRQTFSGVGHRPKTIQRLELGADKDGRLTAIRHTPLCNQSQIGDFFEPVGLTTRMLYACPNLEVVQPCVRLNLPTPTSMRAPGEATCTFALESAMDELAHELSLDPIELRVRNHAAEHPELGLPFSNKHLLECYRLGAEAFGWSRRTPQPRSMRQGRTLVGWGMATSTYPGFRFPAGARARLLSDGSAEVSSATQDLGTGTWTIMAQVAAQELGLPIERVRSMLGDSDFPPAPTSGGSCTVASVTPAVQHACRLVMREAIGLAVADAGSPLHGLQADEVVWESGRLQAQNDPARGESFAELLRRTGREELEACTQAAPYAPGGKEVEEGEGEIDDTARTTGAPCVPQPGRPEQDANMRKYAFQSFGAQFVEVHVDELLGTMRVARVVSVQNVGRVLNARTLRSQIMGGVLMGLGMAFTEETAFDATTGLAVTSNLADYHVMSHADAPEIEVHLLDEPDEHINPLGVRGAGEIGITGVAAAVANAVWHATGRRIRSLPITLDKVRPEAD